MSQPNIISFPVQKRETPRDRVLRESLFEMAQAQKECDEFARKLKECDEFARKLIDSYIKELYQYLDHGGKHSTVHFALSDLTQKLREERAHAF